MRKTTTAGIIGLAAIGALLLTGAPAGGPLAGEAASSFIVQGRDVATAAEAVRAAGGEVTHELRIIDAVGARLTPAQIAVLEQHEAVTRIYQDREVGIRSTGSGPA